MIFTLTFWVGFAFGASLTVGAAWSRVVLLVRKAQKVARERIVLRDRLAAEVVRVQEQYGALKMAEQQAVAHVPAMHEMAMALNRVDALCDCDLCKRYREQRGELLQ